MDSSGCILKPSIAGRGLCLRVTSWARNVRLSCHIRAQSAIVIKRFTELVSYGRENGRTRTRAQSKNCSKLLSRASIRLPIFWPCPLWGPQHSPNVAPHASELTRDAQLSWLSIVTTAPQPPRLPRSCAAHTSATPHSSKSPPAPPAPPGQSPPASARAWWA
jgi:hypothetical protein